jgi:hypothetical protein
MPITLVDHDVPNQMMAVVTGEIGVPELLEFAAAVRSGTRRSWPLIFDASEGVVNVTTEDVKRFAVQAVKGPPIGPVVVIAATPATFGLSRMYQSYAHIAGRTNVGVVRSMAEAQSWLAEHI